MITWMVVFEPATVIELADAAGYRDLPTSDAAELETWFRERRRLRLAGPLPRDVRAHLRCHAEHRRPRPGGRRVRRGPRRGRRRLRRGALRPGAVLRERAEPRHHRRGRAGGLPARRAARARAGPPDPDRHAAVRDAAERALAGDRRARRAPPRHRRRRLRHRRARGRLPAHPQPRRVRVPAPAERALHHPRRRGVRPAVDLGGHPALRRRAARPRRADRRRHQGRRRRHHPLGTVGELRAGPPDPAGDVPLVEHPDRRRALDRRAPDRAADQAALPRHGQHRQPADVRLHDVDARCPRSWTRSATAGPTCSGSRSTR